MQRRVLFAVLQARLIRFLNLRIQNGDFTERGLARILGISQPQVHNVLKGARKLTPELADHLMCRFDMSVLDLLESAELSDQAFVRHARCTACPARLGISPAAHLPLVKSDDLRKV
jgi:plasmid maintenance system antidote protein VapI